MMNFAKLTLVSALALTTALSGCGRSRDGTPNEMELSGVEERAGAVTMKGDPLTLLGPALEAGMPAPDAMLVANDLSEVALSSYDGKIRVLSCVPSLDTPVCDLQTKRFNEEAANLGDDVVILTVSMDLPFAQKRWCGANDADGVVALSDYRLRQFGPRYGVLIEELGLLARAIFVVDAGGQIRYVQLVPEVTNEPDYDEVLNAVRAIQNASA